MNRTQRTVGALTIMVAFIVVVTAFALSTLTDPARGDAAADGPGDGEIGEALATAPTAFTRTVTATQQLTIPAGVVRLTETPPAVTQTVATTGTVVRENVRTVTEEGVRTEVRTERATVTEGTTVTERVGGGGATVTDVVTETVQGPGQTIVETVTETVPGAAPPPQTVTVQAEAPPAVTVTEPGQAQTVTVTETAGGGSE